ncbi:MAG: hypothetical protein HY248_01250 [Fimbriimonas ginsengisoli]|nr:hypothetical protein [Fimbriimonas ginsengisoli]
MANVSLPVRPYGARPPFDGPPPVALGPEDRGDSDDYLADRAAEHVIEIEQFARQPDFDPEALLDLHRQITSWIERLLTIERTIQPSRLPPGLGAQFSVDYLLEPEGDSVARYVALLGRLDDLKPSIESAARLHRLVD